MVRVADLHRRSEKASLGRQNLSKRLKGVEGVCHERRVFQSERTASAKALR
jgi:hypothetical protein